MLICKMSNTIKNSQINYETKYYFGNVKCLLMPWIREKKPLRGGNLEINKSVPLFTFL